MNETAAQRAFAQALQTHRPAFETFFLARLLGLRFAYPESPDAPEPQCVITFDAQDFLFNPQGSLHGGVIAMVLDIAMGHLLKHVQGPGATLEMKTQYVKAAGVGRYTARGEFIKRGPGISYLRATLTDADADDTWNRASLFADTLKPGELLATDTDTLIRRLYAEETLLAFAPHPVRWHCPCTRDRVADMLRMLGHAEVEQILQEQDKVSITCEFCGKPYVFDAVDCAGLFSGIHGSTPSQSLH